MKKICIIEDDSGISASLKLYLENSDYEVALWNTGEKALDFIEETSPQLIILDINLPVMSGIEICREIRKTKNTPIIILTARGSESDRIEGLELGADDYIAKPFSPRELLARIQSVLRRTDENTSLKTEEENTQNDENHFHFQGVTIDKELNTIKSEGVEISVTKNEFDIFAKIMFADGKLVSRESLMKEVIGYDNYVYDRTIDTHIKNLRKKLAPKDLIVTVRGKGYKLNKA